VLYSHHKKTEGDLNLSF